MSALTAAGELIGETVISQTKTVTAIHGKVVFRNLNYFNTSKKPSGYYFHRYSSVDRSGDLNGPRKTLQGMIDEINTRPDFNASDTYTFYYNIGTK